MRIFGKDGDGYELTVRLENAGSLREWLGATSYSKLLPHLTSQAAWHSFMNSTSSSLLNLQMRVRALLFDKAAGCVYEDFGEKIAPSSLNPSYLQLNGNAVYFPLDQDAEDFKRYQANATRTPTGPLRHQPYQAKGQNVQGQHAHNNSRRNLEDCHDVKGGGSISQQRHASQAGHGFNNMMNTKQEMSKPSLNKVKKVEAWDSSDATKRPMEIMGTINKKLRSPKISNKATFQTDGTGVPVRDHQEKMSSHKTAGNLARNSEENSRFTSSTARTSTTSQGVAAETGDVGPLWYDQCAKSYLTERMQRLAQRTAQQKLPFPEREGFSRTPEGMVAYIEFNAKRQKTMCVLKPDADSRGGLSHGQTERLSNEAEKVRGNHMFVPDLKFLANCVPDNPVPAKRRRLEKWDDEPKGLLDRLDELQFRSPNAKLGVVKEETPLTSESRSLQGRQNVTVKKDTGVSPGSSKSDRFSNKVREHEAEHMLRQTVSKLVADAGFEGLKQSSLDLFVDILDSRFKKLSTGLRALIDNYRRQCSQAEYMKMFLQISGSSMEDLMEQVKLGVQKQQLLEQQRQEQEQLLQKQHREQEELQRQKQQREQDELQKQKQQRDEEHLTQQKLQEEQSLKQRQVEDQQLHQQLQNSQKQRQVEHQHASRQPDQNHPHSQQPQQHLQKLRQPEQQPSQPPQAQQQAQKQRQVDQQQTQQQQLQKQRQTDQQHLQQQQATKQRQQDQHHSQQQQLPQPHQHSQKPRPSEHQYGQQPSHFSNHKRRPQPTQSPSRQTLSAKQVGMRPPSAPAAMDSALKQARKACSDTMDQHKQKADQVMGLIRQHPQQSSVDMLASPKQGSLSSPTKGLSKKSPDGYPGLLHQRQPVSQQSSADKAQKRKQQQVNMGRHSPNMGRNPKKVEKERPLDGKSLGETRPMVGKKPMQMMAGGNSSSWHSPIPSVKSQTSPMLQHMKQQASSLQQQ
ncbi:protein MpBromo8 [Marchantia polymorpha subsp. ruderalis]